MSDQKMDSPGRGILSVLQDTAIFGLVVAVAGAAVFFAFADHPITIIRERVLRLPSPTPTVTETPEPTETPEATWTPEPTAVPTSDGRPEADAYRTTIREALDHLASGSAVARSLNADGHPGDASWDSLLQGARRDWQIGRTAIINVWPPGPYDSSSRLVDAQAWALMAVCNLDLALGRFETDTYNQGWDRGAIRSYLDAADENIQFTGMDLDW